MKHAARKTTSVLLSALLLGSSCLMGVSANTVNTDPVSVDTENSYYDSADKTYHVALTINETGSQDAMLDAILNERRLELALEGQRLFDLIRFGKLLEVMNGINSRDEGRLPQARPFVEEHKLMPIPQTALDKNPNLIQNMGY